MPFNMAVASGGRRTFPLSISANRTTTYDIEAQIQSQYSQSTRGGDLIQLTIADAVSVTGTNASSYAIDGDGLHNDAQLIVNIGAGAAIRGRGGTGGAGGVGDWDVELGQALPGPGGNGQNGGDAFRAGCKTEIIGTGAITKGYGGGGGGAGGATSLGTEHGGGGGGGGASLGSGGTGGSGDDGAGNNGSPGTTTAGGSGGSGGGAAGATGGDGGDSGGAGTSGGSASGGSGGSPGSDGIAVRKQGFTVTIDGGITVTGSVID